MFSDTRDVANFTKQIALLLQYDIIKTQVSGTLI
jgi:hypothetical protein